jgi:DNA-binding NarL/FixJ family response regulator
VLNTLIVEDNPLFREFLSAYLQPLFGFLSLQKAASAVEARAKIDAEKPDLVIMDLALGDGSGLSLTRHIRAAEIDAVVIVLTSHDLPEYRDAALRSGADFFMSKSAVNLDAIVSVAEGILESRFKAMVVSDDPAFRRRMGDFLSRKCPGRAIIAGVAGAEEALRIAGVLKPALVVVQSAPYKPGENNLCDDLRAESLHAPMALVSVDAAAEAPPAQCRADFRMPSDAAFGRAMESVIQIIQSLLPAVDDRPSA